MSRSTLCRIAGALFSFAIIFPAMALAGQADSSATDTDSPVIPPAPLIQKKNPNAISIPLTDAVKYQQQTVAATNVKITTDAAAPKAAGAGSGGAVSTNAGSKNTGSVSAASGGAVSASPGSNPAGSTSTVSTNAKVGSTFGYRRDPFTGRGKFHSGCDIKARWGQPVGASLPGTVQFAGWYHGYGNMIVVDHGGGVATHYAHLSSFAVEPGEHVDRGSIIGYAGSTGRATSPHLHYEVRIDGSAVNPLDPLALDESSAFFKNLAAARIVQAAWLSQSAQPGKPDSIKPSVEPAEVRSSQPKAPASVEHSELNQAKPATDNKAATPAPAQPPTGDAGTSQERPRRVTPQK